MPSLCAAVCIYPGTSLSGYRIPLSKEVRSAPAIVVGTVTKVRGLSLDPEDPEGYTDWVYMVRVSEILKGTVPPVMALYTRNNSGGYRMTLGETDLLFLHKRGNFYEADVCGNSGQLGKFGASLEQVKAALGDIRHAP